jgi:hypothetical protein
MPSCTLDPEMCRGLDATECRAAAAAYLGRCALPDARCEDPTGFDTTLAEACTQIPSDECGNAIDTAAATYGMGCIGGSSLAVDACAVAGGAAGGLCGNSVLAEIPACMDPYAQLSECGAQLQLAVGKYGAELVSSTLANRDCLGIGTDVCAELHRRTCRVMPSACSAPGGDLGTVPWTPSRAQPLVSGDTLGIAAGSAIMGYGLGVATSHRRASVARAPERTPGRQRDTVVVHAYDPAVPGHPTPLQAL